MVLGLYEFYLLARKKDMKPDAARRIFGAVALFTIFYFATPDPMQARLDVQILILVLIILTIGTLVAATLRGAPFDKMICLSRRDHTRRALCSFAGRSSGGGPYWLSAETLSALVVFFFSGADGLGYGAYYVGRAIGKHKLAPKISPGKTWEGVAGGVVAGLALATVAHFWFFRELPLKWALPLAAVMTVLGILGDLTESALKTRRRRERCRENFAGTRWRARSFG